MSQKKRKFFLPAILLWFVGLGFWGYYLYTKPHESTKKLSAEVTINAEDLYKQYVLSEPESDKKYLNKIIAVKGKISEIIINGAVQVYVLEKQAGGVSCQMAISENSKKAGIEKGSIVSIKGRCTGFLMDVNLVDCVME